MKKLVFAFNGKANSRAKIRDVDEPETEFQDRPNRRDVSIEEEARAIREKSESEQDFQVAFADYFRVRDSLPVGDEQTAFRDHEKSWIERRKKVITAARKSGQDRKSVPRPDVDDVLKALQERAKVPVTMVNGPGKSE